MSLPGEYFDAVYAQADDPWGFAHRWYERRKRAVLLASLPREHFADGFEPGCSTGELTVMLATRCTALLATDVAERPLARVRTRTADMPHVTIERRSVPADWPPDRSFDLVVLSEICYYLDAPALDELLDLAAGSLAPGGAVVTCHWRHWAPEYPLSGDQVADHVAAAAARHGWSALVHHQEEDFRLEVHAAAGTPSVARAGGLL